MEKEEKELNNLYKKIRKTIEEQFENFYKIIKTKDERKIFTELCFCLLTPQSNAHLCWNAIENLIKYDLLFSGSELDILKRLEKIRFKNNKAKYIILARKFLIDEKNIYKIINYQFDKINELREWLIKNIKGLGYKEASHFLRNIGLGDNFAILDRHILRNLVIFKLIENIPKTLTKNKYLEIEEKMKKFAKKINIPLAHLDMVFWYKSKNEIFK
ncbi:MAG TPA: N-glycosylase/DNA lyase [bacterium]|nr:N-glycosylase/DNA lyase [bacterium]HOL48633.1 N-glycosylase/DNA lyase [bacterium]HPQ19693.1 N-glycosylase/DNA lyase [bacterium]